MAHCYLAYDLGAESGRAVVGTYDQGRLEISVLHRFPTEGVSILGTRQWDATRIHGELLTGLGAAASATGGRLDGVAIDTWGVDFGLLDREGRLLGNPYHYRDGQHDGMTRVVDALLSRQSLYARTGIAALPFNTVYQLHAMSRRGAPSLAAADRMLFMGPLLAYMMTGRAYCEHTIASTSGMLRAGTTEWDAELLAMLGIPPGMLLPVQRCTEIAGSLLPEVCSAAGLKAPPPLIMGAVHDTAAAVAATPAVTGGPWAYLSSGTWSLLGAEIDGPILTEEARLAGYTNEAGASGNVRFLKNIIGLWVLQECRRCWLREGVAQEGGMGYATLVEQALRERPLQSLVNLEDARLLAPADMPRLLEELCREARMPVPASWAAMVRCALESLALCYRRNLRLLDRLLGRRTERLHVIGGGSQNRLLNQLTADACGIPVLAGPAEATAIGNIGVQLIATGVLDGFPELRRMVAQSFPTELFEPSGRSADWDEVEQKVHGEQR